MSTITTISQGRFSISVDSAGAQLTSMSLNGVEYLWQQDPRWWGKSAPVLFPQVGTPGAAPQQSAAGPCDLPKHGFARDWEHELVDVDEDHAAITYEFASTPETLSRYPYPFKLNVRFALTGPATLTQTLRVENTGTEPMPFAMGGHPAFNVPVPNTPEDEGFEDFDLHFERAWTATSPKMVEGGLMSYDDPLPVLDDADVLPITRDLFAYDTVVLKDVPGGTITMTGRKSGRGVRVDFPGYDFVGIWSAAPDAPFVAIEPWTGHAAGTHEDDVLEHREGEIVLAPGEVDERSFSITLLAPHDDLAQVIAHGQALTTHGPRA